MVAPIRFRIVKDDFTPTMKKLGKELPKALKISGRKICNKARINMLNSLVSKNLVWRGNNGGLLSRIVVREKGRKIWVSMPEYGQALDHMKPHWVSLKRGRLITQWALGRPMSKSPWAGMQPKDLPRAIRVRAHPWLNKPISDAVRASRGIIQTELRKIGFGG